MIQTAVISINPGHRTTGSLFEAAMIQKGQLIAMTDLCASAKRAADTFGSHAGRTGRKGMATLMGALNLFRKKKM